MKKSLILLAAILLFLPTAVLAKGGHGGHGGHGGQEEVIFLKEVTALSLVQSLAHFVADSLEAVTLLLRRIEHLLLDRQSLAGNR